MLTRQLDVSLGLRTGEKGVQHPSVHIQELYRVTESETPRREAGQGPSLGFLRTANTSRLGRGGGSHEEGGEEPASEGGG